MTRRPYSLLLAMLSMACANSPGAPIAETLPENRLPLTREAAAELVDLYLSAYETPIANQGGRADTLIWENASTRELQYDTSAYPGGSLANMAHNAMDVAFGFDFQRASTLDTNLCELPERDARRGNIRLIHDVPAALELLDAVRLALREAILRNDVSRVKAALDPFWSGPHWNYVPAHTGRCYPHGHPDMPNVTPSECIVNELELLVGAIDDFRQPAPARDAELTSVMSCDCYWSSDCGPGVWCYYAGACLWEGKLDGICGGGPRGAQD